MKPSNAINAVRTSFEPLSEINDKVFQPIVEESFSELFGVGKSHKSGSLGHEDLSRAREEQKLEKMRAEEEAETQRRIREIKIEYQRTETEVHERDGELRQEVEELTVEVVNLAKAAGVESNVHLQKSPKKDKVSILNIKLLRSIIKTLTLKINEGKGPSELVNQRAGAKSSGMLAWVSGKQMKIHEQGTMQLQG